MLHYIRCGADIGDAERERVQKSKLYEMGDTVLVWVNEGDLHVMGECMDPREPTPTEMKDALKIIAQLDGARSDEASGIARRALGEV